jgi:hypothetical protein
MVFLAKDISPLLWLRFVFTTIKENIHFHSPSAISINNIPASEKSMSSLVSEFQTTDAFLGILLGCN